MPAAVPLLRHDPTGRMEDALIPGQKPLAICAVFKNEAPYVLEWIAYHRVIGFDRFILYDNGSEDGGAALIRASPMADCVTVIDWPQRPAQLHAYLHFIQTTAQYHEWVAFIDLDEFLLPLEGDTIRPLLDRWRSFAGVLVNWRSYGPSGWDDRPPGLAIEAFSRRLPDGAENDRHIKSIVRCDRLLYVSDNPHCFALSGPVCDTLGREVDNIPLQPAACHQVLVLNHYFTRSRRDWMDKLRRGAAMGGALTADTEPPYPTEVFDNFQRDCHMEDHTIRRFAPAVRAMLEGRAVPRGSPSAATQNGANDPMPDSDGQAQPDGLHAASRLIPLDQGLFSLSLLPGPAGRSDGLPGIRVSLPPGPAGRRETVTVSTARGDGWLTSADEPTLIRAGAGGGEVLVTLYWRPADGPLPSLRLARLAGEEAAPAAAPAAARTGPVSSTPSGPGPEIIAAPRPGMPPGPPTGGPGAAPVARPLAIGPAAPAATSGAEVVAHIQGVGDAGGRLGDWIGTRGGGRAIEGFSLSPRQGISAEEFEIRAVLGKDWMSPWLPGNQFCGSRGLALPMRGFCIRLRPTAAVRVNLQILARFVDGSEIGPIGSDQVCAAPSLSPLEAFQIIVRPK